MVFAVSTLRAWLRNDSLIAGPRAILLSSGLLVLAACTQLVGLEGPDDAREDRAGSAGPPAAAPSDTSLPAAPRTDCGDVTSDAANCGFCGHSCGGAACTGGLCAPTVVARSTTPIDAFVTNGVDVFTIEAHAARRCSIANPSAEPCPELVTGDAVAARLGIGAAGPGPGPKKPVAAPSPLAPKAIALKDDGRVVVADDEYKAIIACPATGACTRLEMGVVDVHAQEDSSGSIGRALALGPAGVAWLQGEAIEAAPMPSPGDTQAPIARRDDDTTKNTARIAAPGQTDLFWLSEAGLHYATSPNAPEDRLFSEPATDFAFDTARVYLATASGLVRVSRTDKTTALAAPGRFERVAVDATGIYATKVEPGRTHVIEARAEKQIELAVVDGPVDGLATVGGHVYFAARVGESSEIRRVPR